MRCSGRRTASWALQCLVTAAQAPQALHLPFRRALHLRRLHEVIRPRDYQLALLCADHYAEVTLQQAVPSLSRSELAELDLHIPVTRVRTCHVKYGLHAVLPNLQSWA